MTRQVTGHEPRSARKERNEQCILISQCLYLA